METWIIVLMVLVAAVIVILTIDVFLKCGAKRKARKQMRHNPPVVAAPSIEELNETPNYTGVNLRLPSENVYVLERNFAPVHGVSVDPRQYGYPVSYEDPFWNEKYGKQMPYNPAFQGQSHYQYQ